MQVRLLALLVAASAVVAVTGCDNSTGIQAQFSNTDSKPQLFTLNGSPTSLPTAIILRGVVPTIPDANFNFDLAFDINGAGEVVVYTVKAVASQVAATHQVGLQATTQSFDAATRAPTSGFTFDSSMVLPVGQTVFVQATDVNCATSFLGPTIRAKMVVDSVKPESRTMFLHILSNPNCGFKSLVTGEPRD
ncbi:MAG TPA: hypothetical protein VFT29_19390 [Gemmatimonadaceae bacterium]|nr:hypothetical protein [Gemmatimonadaceae bacterium]